MNEYEKFRQETEKKAHHELQHPTLWRQKLQMNATLLQQIVRARKIGAKRFLSVSTHPSTVRGALHRFQMWQN